MENYDKIVTHFDLDGIASAALCSLILEADSFSFVGPSELDTMQIDKNTIVTDLPYPYPKKPGLWFDHHIANIEELSQLGIEAQTLPGDIKKRPSCLRVIYEYFVSEYEIEDWLPLVNEVDKIDGFLYKSFEDWREETPARTIDHAIKQSNKDFGFMRKLTAFLRDENFEKVAQNSTVQGYANQYKEGVNRQLSLIEKLAQPLENRDDIVLIDLIDIKNPPHIEKNLAYKLFPNALSVLTVKSQYKNGNKTNNISLSMSLGFVSEEIGNKVDIGAIMRELDIGSGHPGAAAGRFNCADKKAREERKEKTIEKIGQIWAKQLSK